MKSVYRFWGVLLAVALVAGCTSYNDYTQGLGQLRKGHYEQAVANLNAAIAKDPAEPKYYSIRGFAYMELKDFQRARKDLDTALKLAPTEAAYAYHRGILHYQMGEYRAALDNFGGAIKGRPRFEMAHYYRGKVFFRVRAYELAIKEFNSAIAMHESNLPAYFHRGLAYRELGQGRLASRDFQYVSNQSPKSPRHRLTKAQALLVLGRKTIARREVDGILREHPRHPDALFTQALILASLGDLEHATGIYDRMLVRLPKDSVILNNRGFNHCLLKNFDRCLRDLTRAIDRNPAFVPAYLNRGHVYLALGDRVKAAKDRKQAKALQRKTLKTLDHWRSEGVYLFDPGGGEALLLNGFPGLNAIIRAVAYTGPGAGHPPGIPPVSEVRGGPEIPWKLTCLPMRLLPVRLQGQPFGRCFNNK